MIARSLHHTSFAVRDLARARAFYGGVLGLQEIDRPDFGGIQGVWYGVGNAEVHLIVKPDRFDVGSPPKELTPIANHVAFGIEDYTRVRDALKARSLELLETSPERGQMWIPDPDGNVIELIARPVPSASAPA